jgi:hypothetical protein
MAGGADGAPRRQFWLARAALLRDETDDRRSAKETLALAGAVTERVPTRLSARLQPSWTMIGIGHADELEGPQFARAYKTSRLIVLSWVNSSKV